jgi:hypothetical protein
MAVPDRPLETIKKGAVRKIAELLTGQRQMAFCRR